MEINLKKIELICPFTKQKLNFNETENYYFTENTKYLIVNNIPRFVEKNNYADSFGYQWKNFAKTQLDSYTKTSISKTRLSRLFQENLNILNKKTVLEIGCGAGRFTELMLNEGANVYAVDLSNAIEANYDNCKQYSNYQVFQANVYNLPFPTESFDVVVCVGVVQHTPNPEKTMQTLCSYLKKDGILVMDNYAKKAPFSLSRYLLRKYLVNKKQPFPLDFVSKLTKKLWKFHLFFFKIKKKSFIGFLFWALFYKISPIFDYQDAYPELGDKLLLDWAILDTHDALTDFYKHLRTKNQIKTFLEKCNLSEINITEAGNGIEVFAKK